MKQGKIFVITGCSGAGKTSVAEKIIQIEELKLEKVITCTTRPIRNGEKNGKDYFFIAKKEFEENINSNKMFEWARVYDNYYGSRKSDVKKILNSGKNVLFVVDVQGAKKIKEENECKVIFISVENLKELEKRLIERATDSLDIIKRRIEEVKEELAFSKLFDTIIINKNGELDETINNVSKYIKSFES